MGSSQKDHWVRIFYSSQPKFVKTKHTILPGILYVNPGDTVNFYIMGTPATVFIPNGVDLFEYPSEEVKVIDKHLIFSLNNENEPSQFEIKSDVPPGKDFPYTVYCDVENNFAEGNSYPTIIIDG